MSKSWYPDKKYCEATEKYLTLLETTFKVQNADKRWVPYILEPHQRHFHSEDVAITHYNAKSRVVVKSRNTSFTVSTIIALLTSVMFYPNQIVPLIRLNQARANDLIKECKKIINNMNMVEISTGVFFPFDKRKVNMDNTSSIKFPNGVEFRAFPANASASETIRGLRISGGAGIIDESNFVASFENIYIALRDAASGSIDGDKAFQITIGTTLKGRSTNFQLWYQSIKNKNILQIHEWPVFDPTKFNQDISIYDQDIVPIVHWHSLHDLEMKRQENINKFLEEYMCQITDNDDQFYPYDMVLNCVNPDLENLKIPDVEGEIFIGCDVASIQDYFTISIFDKVGNKYTQKHLYYIRKVELEDMHVLLCKIVDLWKPYRLRIDANGMGLQLSQQLKRRYGNVIEAVKNCTVKGLEKNQTIRIGEFLHTNQKMLLNSNKVHLISDELQMMHYSAWDWDYKAERTSAGHGDIVISNGLALLPFNWRFGMRAVDVVSSMENEKPDVPEDELKDSLVDFGKKENLKDRLDFFKQLKRNS